MAKGHSGVRYEFLEQLVALIQHDILPRIPREGSVGASGDLCHLSYIGAVMSGFRDVLFEGKVIPAEDALKKVILFWITVISDIIYCNNYDDRLGGSQLC